MKFVVEVPTKLVITLNAESKEQARMMAKRIAHTNDVVPLNINDGALANFLPSFNENRYFVSEAQASY